MPLQSNLIFVSYFTLFTKFIHIREKEKDCDKSRTRLKERFLFYFYFDTSCMLASNIQYIVFSKTFSLMFFSKMYFPRPMSQSGRPLSGFVRPGTQSARPGTMEQALRSSRTAGTAR